MPTDRGWLKRQFARAEADYQTLPYWLRRPPMAAETPLEREYPHFEEIYNLVTGKDGRAMTTPNPLEQAREKLREAHTRLECQPEDAHWLVRLSGAEIDALLAATTPEPARLSAEAALAAVDRVMQRARMWDLGHPQAMIQSLIDDIRSELRALAAPPPEPARLSAEQVDDLARTLAVKLATFEPRSDDLTPTQTRFNMAKAEILRALAAPPQGTDNG